jgi:hypothetical protein
MNKPFMPPELLFMLAVFIGTAKPTSPHLQCQAAPKRISPRLGEPDLGAHHPTSTATV